MSDKDLTAPEAVERLARHTEKACKCEFDGIDVSAALRALSARVAELEALARRTTEERDHDKERAEAAEARVAEWRAEYETSDNMHKLYERRCAELIVERDAGLVREQDTNTKAFQHLRRAEAAEAEQLEQSRLLGMSAERELSLRTKLEAAEAERDALKAENARLREALEYIQKPQYGLQSIIEDGDSDEEIANYFCAWCRRYQDRARAALRALEQP